MSEIAKQSQELRHALGRHTPARVGLGRAGAAIATEDQLRFQLDHALARDAVHARLDVAGMLDGLRRLGFEAVALQSAVEEGRGERQSYLRRPDLGRRLGEESAQRLGEMAAHSSEQPDVVFVVADGLSALAVQRHALALLETVRGLMAADAWRVGPVCVAIQGRVAIGDEIGALLGAKLVVMLIGERPGLSAADSLGVYITWAPRVGRTDAERNCISNVRHEGLSYAEAARRVVSLMREAKRLGGTGVGVKTGAVPLIA